MNFPKYEFEAAVPLFPSKQRNFFTSLDAHFFNLLYQAIQGLSVLKILGLAAMGMDTCLILYVNVSLMYTSGVGASSNEHGRCMQMALIIKFFFIKSSRSTHAALDTKIPPASVSQVLLPKELSELPRQGQANIVLALSSCFICCIEMPKRFMLKWVIHPYT